MIYTLTRVERKYKLFFKLRTSCTYRTYRHLSPLRLNIFLSGKQNYPEIYVIKSIKKKERIELRNL